MIDIRTRILAIAGSLVLLLFVVDLVRRRKLKEEYSVLWVAASVVLLILAAWYELLEWMTDVIGGVALSSTLFFFALLFVFFMLLHYSVRISALERRFTALVQESALAGVRRRPPIAGGAEPVTPRVAVIIPCYDDGPLVREALASIREAEPVETVVVDDGSTDPRTLGILSGLEAEGVHVVRGPNRGPSAARTSGLQATSAPLVYPLDADDRLDPGALGAMADALDADPGADFAWGDYVLFGAGSGRYKSPDRWLPWTLTYVNPYPVSSMFRRPVLEQAGGWQGWAYEDWDLWLRLVGLGRRGLRVDRVVYHRRLHTQTRRNTTARSRHQEFYAEIRRRNAGVFARRKQLRRDERPAGWKRVAYPVLFGARRIVPVRVEALLQRTMMRLGTGLPG